MTRKEMLSTLPPELPKMDRVIATTAITLMWPLYRPALRSLPMSDELSATLTDVTRQNAKS